MKTIVTSQWSAVSLRQSFLCLVLLCVLGQLGCSIPNLEKPQCTAARESVKHFYSLHFGNDMRPSEDYLKVRGPFLTTDLQNTLSASNETVLDYFTKTENYPRAFRVGECTSNSPDETSFQIQLLWRSETETKQQNVQAEALFVDDKWLINKVTN